ncbi:N-acetyltransferase [uncultured Maritalea sp.]|uniref:GNAT family N-acetyltransferase n=1 Tax=uncultured Maritalea sp. TaxID=757249 RepID=UPI00260391B5|nr:N-acetyltransferase [uncultured Maritalea sp.]
MSDYLTLAMNLGDPIPHGIWPMDVQLVAFSPAEHATQARQLLNLCYANGGGEVQQYDEWWSIVAKDAEYDSTLCFPVVSRDTRELVAFAHCWTSGFVKDIAVHPKWRRRGIAQALMADIFLRFQERGSDVVRLKVVCDNPHGAVEFYQAIGMSVEG